ncbi:MAG: hypothetical protein QOC67_1195 [Pseudonocardiales bacterium]|nr:hypothetical protein [Pseudonocardiales bacterium]
MRISPAAGSGSRSSTRRSGRLAIGPGVSTIHARMSVTPTVGTGQRRCCSAGEPKPQDTWVDYGYKSCRLTTPTKAPSRTTGTVCTCSRAMSSASAANVVSGETTSVQAIISAPTVSVC